VRQLRTAKQLHLADIAKRADLSVSYLNEIEKGKKYPKANKIAALAKALDVSYDSLISLQLDEHLAPLADLIQSDWLRVLPLDVFGLEPHDLLETLANSPTKLNALVSTLMEIARHYDMRVGNFYQSVLRAYQEMHDNYFEEIEEAVEKFRQACLLAPDETPDLDKMLDILRNKYGYVIDEETLPTYPELKSLRSVLLPNNPPKLLLNPALSTAQKQFTLGRELGYLYMKLSPRPYTFSWIKVDSFNEVKHNFEASYFSAALLMPRDAFIKDLTEIFNRTTWQPESFIDLMHRYKATPEMLMHRLTNLVPKFFGIERLFFLRFYKEKAEDDYQLNKELHLAGLYNPHGVMMNEHYCRRWISLNSLKSLEARQVGKDEFAETLCEAQISQYYDSPNEYLCISLASPISPTPNTNMSVTIGFLVNDIFKQKVKFWQDSKIPVKRVGVACERCSATDCQDRKADAIALENESKATRMQKALKQLIEKMEG
jgi:transcriptional regulator with XRE-family HTH domain